MSLKTPRHADWRDWFRDLYRYTPWESIKKVHKRQIVRIAIDPPDHCPSCGSPVEHPWLCSISGKFKDDHNDYEYLCPQCAREKYHPKKQGECYHGQNLKPWSELKRRARVARIRKLLPMPAACAYCDNTKVELVSRSGTWQEETLSDYVWVCRSHAVMMERLQPEKKPEPLIVREPWDPELFPHWYNVTMPGTFQGTNILGLRCLAGRFL